jgi:predicted GNAT family acetyltransferase
MPPMLGAARARRMRQTVRNRGPPLPIVAPARYACGMPQHDAPRERFTIERDGQLAQLVYRAVANRLLLLHTEVPEALGGRGIGGELVEMALERARRDALVVVPHCPFARAWVRRHPSAAEGITISWPAEPPDG